MMNLFSLLAFENLDPMNKDTILKSLNILWQGMLAIFVVIGLIIITVKISGFVINKVEQAKKAREQQAQENSDDGNA